MEQSLKKTRRRPNPPFKDHPLYGIWNGIIQRCTNPKRREYRLYGGRGIKLCALWRADFFAFATHMGERPSPEHSVDRIDNNGNYEPGNCRWATWKEQAANQRNAFGARTHCRNGHPYSGDNLRITNGARYCRECNRVAARKCKANRLLREATLEHRL